MSTPDTTGAEERSPFTRPGFIAAAVVVALIAVAGVVVALTSTTRSQPPTPASSSSPPSSALSAPASAQSPGGGSSVCGLEGEVTEQARLSQAPDVDYWDYQGTTAYPVSAEFGPGATDPAGFRYCFQHSPEGALYAAANAVSQGSDPTGEWLNYVVAEGPYRDQLVSDTGTGEDSDETRISIVGFRLLEYEGSTARVDIAGRATVEGQTLTVSGVYELVWQGGDWKLSSEVAEPLTLAEIPDTSGYVIWGEQPGG
ncbi:hypothetical protein D4740_01835 [Actinomyces sp. 2119]|uniref:hypothetical protein n=1 Tax=Actinomyces sp. 2119 TaxID=2321393 RepID=UPI000E6BE8A1|nr:hypothetical protein [Actinomyces sp. 2119]RJF44919.1 hypothetical protein D4740_01835 [Actinomyces sp. 2119]